MNASLHHIGDERIVSSELHKIQTKKLFFWVVTSTRRYKLMYPTTFVRMLLATVQAAMNVG